GWLDLVALKYAAQINGMDALAITKLDILDDFDEIRVCVSYDSAAGEIHEYPTSIELLEQCKPVWKSFRGWKSNTYALRKLSDLPAPAREYLEFIEDYLMAPVALISTSPERDDTVFYPAFDTICER
ncbi:MAG TPA: adenylosuccinate synthetase, partial [Acidobacteriota bacterium]